MLAQSVSSPHRALFTYNNRARGEARFAIQNAQSAKEEFIGNVREELKGHFAKIDPSSLIQELVENYDVEINAKLTFKRKGPKKTKKKKS